MPANNADEILVGADGAIFVGETTATAPSSLASSTATYNELGFTTEAGVTLSDGKNITDIPVWQSFYPARKIVDSRSSQVSFALRQWNAHNVELAFGGGTVTPEGGGEFSYTPPSPEDIDERSVIVDWEDGDKNYRLYIPRAIVTNTVDSNLTRTAAADLPITLEALSNGTDPVYTLFTDDPSFADYSS